MIKLTIEGEDIKEFDTDQELLDYMMAEQSSLIPPEAYDAIQAGLTVYNGDEDEVKRLEEETGQDAWDGESLVRWIAQGGDTNIITTQS